MNTKLIKENIDEIIGLSMTRKEEIINKNVSVDYIVYDKIKNLAEQIALDLNTDECEQQVKVAESDDLSLDDLKEKCPILFSEIYEYIKSEKYKSSFEFPQDWNFKKTKYADKISNVYFSEAYFSIDDFNWWKNKHYQLYSDIKSDLQYDKLTSLKNVFEKYPYGILHYIEMEILQENILYTQWKTEHNDEYQCMKEKINNHDYSLISSYCNFIPDDYQEIFHEKVCEEIQMSKQNNEQV